MDPRLRYYYNRLVDFEEAKRILAAFERDGVQYVLIESMAMAAQGLIRATRDVDFFVSKTWSRKYWSSTVFPFESRRPISSTE